MMIDDLNRFDKIIAQRYANMAQHNFIIFAIYSTKLNQYFVSYLFSAIFVHVKYVLNNI